MKKLIIILLVTTLFIQCQSNQIHLIQKNQVGLITKTTKVKDLDKVFVKDSLVKTQYEKNQPKFLTEDYEVYSKKGTHLLTINIENDNDSTSIIQSVQIFSPIYKTKKEISIASVFKDLKENYDLKKVESTITSVSIYVNELNASFNITNKDMGISEFNTNKISLDQIPDNAPFKYITVWLN